MLLVSFLASASLSPLPAAPQGDRSYRLNGPLPATIGGDVDSPVVSPDGTRVVYRVDLRREESFELFSAPVDGSSAPIRISGRLVPGGSVQAGYVFSADGRSVVYRADGREIGLVELFVVPIDGNAPPLRLSGALVDGGSVQEGFALSPTRVVFLADSLVDQRFLLHSAPLDASSPPVVLNAPLVGGGDVEEFQITSDRTRVLYLGNHMERGRSELFVAPIDRSQQAVQLSDGPEEVISFSISPDDQRVVYRLWSAADSQQFRSRPIDGSSPSVAYPGNVLFGAYRITLDSSRVVYTRKVVIKQHLFHVPIDGSSAPVQLTAFNQDVRRFELTPDGSIALFIDPSGHSEQLFRVPIDGSSLPVRLNDSAVAGGIVQAFALDASGGRVVFLGDLTVDGRFDLYSVPLLGSGSITLAEDVESFPTFLLEADLAVFKKAGEPDKLYGVPIDGSSAPVVLTDPLVPGGRVRALALSSVGPRVLYSADQDVLGVIELFSAPLVAAGSTQINDEFPSRFAVGQVVGFAQTERVAVYVADQEEDDLFELFGVSTRGAEAPYRLSEGEVDRVAPRVTPDGKRALFLAGGELHSTRVDGSGTPVRLNGTLMPGGAVVDYALSSDSQWVVYLADQRTDETFELFARPVDGRARPVRLNAPLVGGGDVTHFEISSDATRTVYLADQERDGVFELFSTDGRNSPIRLHPPLASERDVTTFQITPDGERVLALVDLLTNDSFILTSASIDGSAGPVPLSGPLAQGEDVEEDFVISADGQWVAYRADRGADGVIELFGVRASGESAPRKLSPVLVLPGLQISPDSTRVVFRAKDSGNALLLGSALLEGAGAPAVLHRVQASNQFPFEITPDARRVVFTSMCGLLQVPIDGSAPAVDLTVIPTGVDAIEISPDSSFAVYLEAGPCQARSRLWFVPLEGGGAPIQVSDPVPLDGRVKDFALSPDGARVLYRADRDELGADELFATRLQKGPLPAGE